MTDEEVFQAVRRLVAAGEYLDDIPGQPGLRTESGSHFNLLDTGVWQRIYRRGSSEHLEARASGETERLPPLLPATREAVEEAEARIGHPLPALLRLLYLEIGNGGFGPGYGILGVRGGHPDDRGATAVDLLGDYEVPRTTLLPVCHWGCAIYSLVDCASTEGWMWGFDPNPGEDDLDFFPEKVTFTDWLGRWTSGRLSQPAGIEDPETGEWRGATQEEAAASLRET